jgi:hypothetical protein
MCLNLRLFTRSFTISSKSDKKSQQDFTKIKEHFENERNIKNKK